MNKKLIAASLLVVLLFAAALTLTSDRHVSAAAPTPTLPPTINKAIELTDQGNKQYESGQYADAINSFAQALDIMQRMGYRANQGVLLSNMGAAYEAQGQFVKALDLANQALTIAIQTGNTLGQAQTLANIGNIYAQQGQYSKAADYFTQSLALFKRLGDRAAQGDLLTGFGNVYRGQGQLTKALDAYSQSLTIAKQLGESQDEGVILSNIGIVYQQLGQYGEALNTYNQALTLAQKSGDRATEARTFAGIGNLYIDQGEYDRGVDSLNQALSIETDLGAQDIQADILNSIGSAYSEQGEYDQALKLYNQALTLYTTLGIKDGEAIAIFDIGLIYKREEKYPEALDNLNHACDLSQQLNDQIDAANCLASIGGLYSDQGDGAKGLDFLKQALAIQQSIGGTAALASTYSNIGLAYQKLDQMDDAITNYQSAASAFETLLNEAGLESSASSLLADPDNVVSFHTLAYLLASKDKLEDAINYAERGHAVVTRAELLSKPVDVAAKTDQASLQHEADLRYALNSAQALLDSLRNDASAPPQDIQAAQTTLDKAQSDYQTFIESLQLQGGFATRQFAGEVATLSQIQAAIPPDTTLLLYSINANGSVVFLITPTSADAAPLDFDLTDLQDAVNAFMADRQANADKLSTIYDLIIKPAADGLKTKRLMIAPDGILNYIPFAALQEPNGHYLIDDYAISMIPSATTLVMLQDRKAQAKAASPGLVLAQPSAPGLPRLEYARTEASNVAKLLGVNPILDASETDLRQHATSAKILTISAHVELDLRQPLFGSIDLKSPAATDSRFEVRNIYELDLTRGTDLVVLSGCNTATGGNGEDFGVLTRAFFAAGTPRVVASLWSVDDASTNMLITTYMSQRATLGNDADALQAAMIATRAKYPDPYFWAGFVLNGLAK